ncbi:MAG: hypothetical protein ACTSUT_08070 [Promethearchaeota archaeon]
MNEKNSENILEKELRIAMEEEFFEKLEAIKDFYGIKNNTEIIRFMIKDKFRELFRDLERKTD